MARTRTRHSPHLALKRTHRVTQARTRAAALRRFLALSLVAALTSSFVACSSGDAPTRTPPSTPPPPSSTPHAPEAPIAVPPEPTTAAPVAPGASDTGEGSLDTPAPSGDAVANAGEGEGEGADVATRPAGAIALPIEDASVLSGTRPMGCELLAIEGGHVLRSDWQRGAPDWAAEMVTNATRRGVFLREAPADQAARLPALGDLYVWTPDGPCRVTLGPLQVYASSEAHEPDPAHAVSGCGDVVAPLAMKCSTPPPALRWVPIVHERTRVLRGDAPSGDRLLDAQRRAFPPSGEDAAWQREEWEAAQAQLAAGEVQLMHRARISQIEAPESSGVVEALTFIDVQWAFYAGSSPAGSCPTELFSYESYARVGSEVTRLHQTFRGVEGGLHDGRRFVALIWKGAGLAEHCEGAASCMATRLAFRRASNRFRADARGTYARGMSDTSSFEPLAYSNHRCGE